MIGNGNETHYLYIVKSDNQLLFRGTHRVQGCDFTVLNMQIQTKIYFTCSLTWMQNLFLHRKGQTEDGEIKERGKKKSGVNYIVRILICTLYAIQGLLKKFSDWLNKTQNIHSVFCLMTGPKPPPKRFLHIVQSRVSSFKWEYPLLSLRSSSSFLHLLPRLLVTSISPFIFPSITCFRRQFLCKMWSIQLAFCFLI